MVADGMSEDEILVKVKVFPDLEHENLKKSLHYDSESAESQLLT